MSSLPAVLLGDRFAPITSQIGFLNIRFDQAVSAVQAWHEKNAGPPKVASLSTSALPERLRALEPLTLSVPREAWIGCADPEWVAVFDCRANGSDPVSAIGHLSRTLKVPGLVVASVPTATSSGSHGRWVARQFQMLGAETTGFLNYVRTLSLTQDGKKWRFDANGHVQDFEDESAYQRRKVADRLTPEMLIDYCQAVGVRPFDENFYNGPSVLVTKQVPTTAQDLSLTLEQARERLGITP